MNFSFPVNGEHSDFPCPRWDFLWVLQNHWSSHSLHNSRFSVVWHRPQQSEEIILLDASRNTFSHRWNFCSDCLTASKWKESIPYLNNSIQVFDGDTNIIFSSYTSTTLLPTLYSIVLYTINKICRIVQIGTFFSVDCYHYLFYLLTKMKYITIENIQFLQTCRMWKGESFESFHRMRIYFHA